MIHRDVSELNPNQWHAVNLPQLGFAQEVVPVLVVLLKQRPYSRIRAYRLHQFVVAHPTIAIGISVVDRMSTGAPGIARPRGFCWAQQTILVLIQLTHRFHRNTVNKLIEGNASIAVQIEKIRNVIIGIGGGDNGGNSKQRSSTEDAKPRPERRCGEPPNCTQRTR